MHRRRPTLVILLAIVLLAPGCALFGRDDPAAPSAPAIGSKPAEPLRILLTNDDGYSSPGIRAVREALIARGHDVTLVAPLENRSGSSSSITSSGALELIEQEPGIFSVSGTPADSVLVGLDVVMAEGAPDVVVSGANFGENIGPATLVSGTVGAAMTAMRAGVPAVAISVGMNLREARAEPVRFPSTLAAFPGAAELTADVLRELDTTRYPGEALLPPHTIVNINYPARRPEHLAGVRYAEIGTISSFRFGYKRGEGNVVALEFQAGPEEHDTPEADTTLFEQGWVTITVLDGDVRKDLPERGVVETRVGAVVAPTAPAEEASP